VTNQRQKAAELVAAGKLTLDQIATETGVSRRTIAGWKNDKEFQAAVKQIKNAWRVKARGDGIADLDLRLRSRNDLHKRLLAVIAQRAKDPQFKDVPGGDTGLLTVTYKMQSQGEGKGSTAVPEYAIDTGLLDALTELKEHQAIEKGEWKAKVEYSGSVDINVLMDRINAGRKRVADEKVARDEASKTKVP
jgi:putative insertion element HTH domain-containing protein